MPGRDEPAGPRRPRPALSARENARLRDRWRTLLRERHIAERDLAERLHVSPSTLTSVGRSPAGPTLATLMRIRDGLGLKSIDELLATGETREAAPNRRIYVAGPFGFTEAGRDYLKNRVLPAMVAASLEPLNPWAAADGILGPVLREERRKPVDVRRASTEVGQQNAAMIEQASAVLALIDGCDLDSGTCAEIGYAAARSKPVVALRTDFRLAGDVAEIPINLQVDFFIQSSGGGIVGNLDDAIVRLGEIV